MLPALGKCDVAGMLSLFDEQLTLQQRASTTPLSLAVEHERTQVGPAVKGNLLLVSRALQMAAPISHQGCVVCQLHACSKWEKPTCCRLLRCTRIQVLLYLLEKGAIIDLSDVSIPSALWLCSHTGPCSCVLFPTACFCKAVAAHACNRVCNRRLLNSTHLVKLNKSLEPTVVVCLLVASSTSAAGCCLLNMAIACNRVYS
jgi:hypothetical protein